MNRLTAYTISREGMVPGFPLKREYTYEGYNRKTERILEEGSEVELKTYNYDQTNWLTSITGQVSSGDSYAITYAYDNNGNTLSKVDSRAPADRQDYLYSADDRLVRITRGPPGSEEILGLFDYNLEGNRVRHRLSDRGDVDYFYDDGSVIEEQNAADGSLLAYYVYADRLIALAQPMPKGKQYYHHDALGSTIGLTDAAGNDAKSYRLDPWGNIRAQSGISDNRRIFTGKEHDTRTGLVYFGARFYDPETARFITQDTYLGEPNQPPSLHRYLYAYSNPARFIDRTGHQAAEVGDSQPKEEGAQKVFTAKVGRKTVSVALPDDAAEDITLTGEDSEGVTISDDAFLKMKRQLYELRVGCETAYSGEYFDDELFSASCSGTGFSMECDYHAYESSVREKQSEGLVEKASVNAIARLPFIFLENACDPGVCEGTGDLAELVRPLKFHPSVRDAGVAMENALQALILAGSYEAATADFIASAFARSFGSSNGLVGVSRSIEAAGSLESTPISGSEGAALFRGTSEGFESTTAARLGITPVSKDPVVATVFARHSESFGRGVLQVARMEDLAGVDILQGNVFRELEREVGVAVRPTEFAARASVTVRAEEAVNALEQLGIRVPSVGRSVESVRTALENTPRLGRDQISQFLNLIRGRR